MHPYVQKLHAKVRWDPLLVYEQDYIRANVKNEINNCAAQML